MADNADEQPENPKGGCRLEDLRHESTEEERAEDKRRWKAIYAGLHPDTDKPLRPGDEKALRPDERMYLDPTINLNLVRYGTSYPSAIDLMMKEEKNRQQMIDAAMGGPERRAMEEAMRLGQPAWLEAQTTLRQTDFARQEIERFMGQHQGFVGAALGTADEIRRHMDAFEQHRRFVAPLMDQDFVRRMVHGVDNDLMRRATLLAEVEAVRDLRTQVDASAITQMTNEWRQWERNCGTLATANSFGTDAALMASEAQRMLSIYGPAIAERTKFLHEFNLNVSAFGHSATLSIGLFERADLLARIVSTPTLGYGFDGYDPRSVEAVRQYWESALKDLQEDFSREQNPVHAWQALSVARSTGNDVPEWVMDYLDTSANNIMRICEEVADGKRAGKEADRVGKALGFGIEGPGQAGWFKHATILERDRKVFFEVVDHLETGVKLDFVYDSVAKKLNTSRSTVVRAYLRIKAVSNDDGNNAVS